MADDETPDEAPAFDPCKGCSVEQKRLEATALVASRVSREEATHAVRRANWLSYTREAVIVILVIAVALLSYRSTTESDRTSKAIDHNRQRDCGSLRKFGLIVPQRDTTVVGLQILAQNRNSYYLDDCNLLYGRLPEPDPRMLPYLIKQAQH